ncbi:MAG: tyrosine--tRNA ligase [Candidatus Dormibacteria bacterium]
MTSPEQLLRGIVHCEDRAHLQARLERGERLRIKFGIDPSAPDLHLGHTVPLRLLNRWQQAGHVPVLIVGDVTARIGDPSGRSETRPQLSSKQVEANAQTYLDQLFQILDPAGGAEVRRQSEWFGSLDLVELLRLAATATVAQLLQRSDFEQRLRAQQAIGFQELLYPLLQGYDSVAVAADVELGGTDQLFNLLRGRQVQEAYGQAPQDVVTVPLLEGLDGVRKMSKSLGNAVGVTDGAGNQFGQLMTIPDPLIGRYRGLLTETSAAELERLRQGLEDGTVHPRDAKADLAEAVVAQFHGAGEAAVARQEFFRVHRDRQPPSQLAAIPLPRTRGWDVRDLLVAAGMASSRSEAARLVQGGAVELAGGRVGGWREPVDFAEGAVLRVGPHRAGRLVSG